MEKELLIGNLIDKLNAFHQGKRNASSPLGERGIFSDAYHEIERLTTVVLISEMSLRERLEASLLVENINDAINGGMSVDDMKQLSCSVSVFLEGLIDKCAEKGINMGISRADARDQAILARMRRQEETNGLKPE